MEKIWLVLKREYLTRVTKKSFILTTVLAPVAMAIFMAVVVFLIAGDHETTNILVKDDSGLLKESPLSDHDNVTFSIDNSGASLEDLKKSYGAKDKDGLLYIGSNINTPTIIVEYFSDKDLATVARGRIKSQLREKILSHQLKAQGIDQQKLELVNKLDVEIEDYNIQEDGSEEKAQVAVGGVIGMVMGMLIMFTILVYGSMVMRSVTEEKTSRIIEVMASSVKPFQLMLGKIIGVGLVGLTQFLMWGVLTFFLNIVLGLVLGTKLTSMTQASMPTDVKTPSAQEMSEGMELVSGIINAPWATILPVFLLLFLGGYFLYSALFAAIGAAAGEDLAESQALTLPVTMPIMLSFYIGMSSLNNPNSSLVYWASLFPLSSPVVMAFRLGFEPHWTEIALCLILLIATCIGVAWLAAKIYRVGILMYGKKVTFKELGKWIFYK